MTRPLATGQTRCHGADGRAVPCLNSGQDAEERHGLPWPAPRFTPLAKSSTNGAIAVRDELTGLEWTRNAAPFDFPLTWDEARQACEELNAPQIPPEMRWRLPNRRELFSLLSFDHANPALPADHPFENVPSLACWTSTRSARNADYYWYVQLSGGRMFYHRKDSSVMVWPVRGRSAALPETGRRDEPATGAAWPVPRFETQTNGVVRDRLTQLVWTRDAHPEPACLWQEALDRVAALNRARHLGIASWRLPTIRELESLVDASQHDPALPEGHPFTGWQEAYWSSTTSAFETDWAMCLYLHKGAVGVGYKPGPEPFALWPCADGAK
ncbi:MAG: DUF1566 domain-containing protein [Desulfovibrio sp.]